MSTPAVHCDKVTMVPLADIKPNPRNPNKHPDEQVRLLAKNIEHHGWRLPITVSNRSGLIVRGHARLLAAQVLGLAEALVSYQDYGTDEDELADLLTDNRLAELAEMDNPGLKDLLEELDTGAFDVELAGFSDGELERLMSQFHVPESEPEYDESIADGMKSVICPKCGHEFPV